uniref:Uncharacterized protein n=1 Tax=Sphaerodactylus townsendi TaxID=933632 RepID=A0ACB8EWU8_9SAUR
MKNTPPPPAPSSIQQKKLRPGSVVKAKSGTEGTALPLLRSTRHQGRVSPSFWGCNHAHTHTHMDTHTSWPHQLSPTQLLPDPENGSSNVVRSTDRMLETAEGRSDAGLAP